MLLRWVTFAFVTWAALGAQPHHRKPSKGSADRVVQPKLSFDPRIVVSPVQSEVLPGDKSSSVVRAQILLDRAHFSCGEIDGEFGTNLQKVLAAYQADRHLPPSGKVDDATWAALNADTAPALLAYNVSADDVKGPFAPVPKDMLAQAELPALGYASPLEGLAEKFHSSPKLLQALNPGGGFDKAGQPMLVPNVITMPPGEAAQVVVSKSQSAVMAYDAAGKLLAFYAATIGSEHDPLPIGDWKIRGVARNPEFHYNPDLFWDAKPGDTKATIKPGPNNPVGVVWIDLSKDHYGIHGTPEPSRIGHTTSHGCIRLTNWDAAELASMVKPGVPALLKE
jgi:lipoprotein-anchoring transpeptidase ErfK/SrfK